MKQLIAVFTLVSQPVWAALPKPEAVVLPGMQQELQQYNYHQTADGKLAVFAQSKINFLNPQIMLARQQNKQWQQAVPVSFSQAEFSDTDPFINADGSRLVFISDRGKTQEQAHPLDIFVSTNNAGVWSEPVPLAPQISSAAIELGPEQHQQMLYFSSTRPGGPSTLSVYQYNATTEQTTALPVPVNQGQQNSDFTISPDGHYALWWSTRAGGQPQLYMSTVTANGFGPATLLPEPINSPAGEITPNFTPDGQWLYFASDRASKQGLYKLYRVSWPAIVSALSPKNAIQ